MAMSAFDAIARDGPRSLQRLAEVHGVEERRGKWRQTKTKTVLVLSHAHALQAAPSSRAATCCGGRPGTWRARMRARAARAEAK